MREVKLTLGGGVNRMGRLLRGAQTTILARLYSARVVQAIKPGKMKTQVYR